MPKIREIAKFAGDVDALKALAGVSVLRENRQGCLMDSLTDFLTTGRVGPHQRVPLEAMTLEEKAGVAAGIFSITTIEAQEYIGIILAR